MSSPACRPPRRESRRCFALTDGIWPASPSSLSLRSKRRGETPRKNVQTTRQRSAPRLRQAKPLKLADTVRRGRQPTLLRNGRSLLQIGEHSAEVRKLQSPLFLFIVEFINHHNGYCRILLLCMTQNVIVFGDRPVRR